MLAWSPKTPAFSPGEWRSQSFWQFPHLGGSTQNAQRELIFPLSSLRDAEFGTVWPSAMPGNYF